ncbi:MAG: BMP family ABC transporter substrate-binding protein, partial [Clostridia bacterium]|nr:BMP family ABC transporter substrate-binding protein [Clostridia bacterium]
MKKLLCLLLGLFMALSLAACGAVDTTPPEGTEGPQASEGANQPAGNTFEIALITDIGTIDDKSFNQGAWEGVEAFAQEKGKTFKYYQPTEQSDDAYLTAIDLAVKAGAKVIVTPGFLFGKPIYDAQDQYPETHFILLDAVPNNGDFDNYDVKINDNAVGIGYAEDQAGFLAGYAAVLDGYRELGFMGGIAVPAVIRFGYGYVQGAEYAAQELGLAQGDVTIRYHYTMTFSPAPEIATRSASWYAAGTAVIFSCG